MPPKISKLYILPNYYSIICLLFKFMLLSDLSYIHGDKYTTTVFVYRKHMVKGGVRSMLVDKTYIYWMYSK